MCKSNQKSTKLSSKISTTTPCPLCHRRQTLRIDIHACYHHVLALPTLPTGKVGEVTCEACGYEFYTPYMPQKFKDEYADLEQKTKIPLYYSLGAILSAATLTGTVFLAVWNFC